MHMSGCVRYNLTCSTEDGRVADWIARELQKRIGQGVISAKGIAVEPGSNARILTVIYDPVKQPPYKVLEMARALGRRFNVEITDADIVGDIPLEVVLVCAGYALSVARIRPTQVSMEKQTSKGSDEPVKSSVMP